DQCDDLLIDRIDGDAKLVQPCACFVLRHACAPKPLLRLRTNSSSRCGSSGPAFCSITRTIALPTTTASTCAPNSATCSGFETPNPTASGRSVTARMLRINGATDDESESRSPVTPVRDTRYTKPVEYCATSFNRRSVLVGAARNTVSSPWRCIAAT